MISTMIKPTNQLTAVIYTREKTGVMLQQRYNVLSAIWSHVIFLTSIGLEDVFSAGNRTDCDSKISLALFHKLNILNMVIPILMDLIIEV